MSAEIQLKSPITTPQYAIVQNLAGQVWNTNSSAFETENNSNWHYYAIILAPSGVGDNYLSANFPTGIVTSGVYLIFIYNQLGNSPVYTDTLLVEGFYNWPGASVGPATNYITLATLKTYLNISVETYDTLLSQLISQASLSINNSLRRNLILTFYYEYYDGTGYSFLRTNAYPIISITNIQNIYATPSNSTTTVYPGSNFVYNTEGTIRWRQGLSPSQFWAGYQNYIVAYEGGYNGPLPQDLQLACCQYVQFLWNYSQRDLTVDNKKIKEDQIAYGNSLFGEFSKNAIFAPIEAILSRYKQISTL